MNWSEANSRFNGYVLVIVNRRRTASYLAKYLSNCRQLLIRNVQTTCIADHCDGSADEGMSADLQWVC